jgi:ubiquinone/menaquinone biosynthesis C-methylase UbiE
LPVQKRFRGEDILCGGGEKMKMVKFEKWFINSNKHAERVINRATKLLQLADVKENQSFLEVGCGGGAVCKYVAKKYPLYVTGVDVDPEQIQLAQKNIDNIENIRFLTADATNLPFPDNDFDVVLSFGTTHHISNWLDALSEIRRVLKPKGYFIYYELLYSRPLAKLGRSFKHSYGITTMPELNSFTQMNDFSAIHTAVKNSLIWSEYEAVYHSN